MDLPLTSSFDPPLVSRGFLQTVFSFDSDQPVISLDFTEVDNRQLLGHHAITSQMVSPCMFS